MLKAAAIFVDAAKEPMNESGPLETSPGSHSHRDLDAGEPDPTIPLDEKDTGTPQILFQEISVKARDLLHQKQ